MAEQRGLFEKALETVEKHRMIQQGDTVAAGVSGGADSVALLDFLCRIREELSLTVAVCHLNHRLRGGESDRDEAFTRDLAAGYGLPFRCRRADAAEYAEEHRCSVEEAGRALRYAFFRECAGEGGRIATAHTLSDSMETLLLNLCRGTGLRGLRGIPPVRGQIVRPLIACTRQEVEAYCRQRGLGWVTDSSNLSPDYARNRVRLEVLPRLAELNPALPAAFAGLMGRMEEQWRLVSSLAEEAEGRLNRGGRLDREGLLALPPAVAETVLLRLLEQAGAGGSARLVEELLGTARRGRGEVQLGPGLFFTVRGDTAGLVRRRPPPEDFPPRALDLSEGALPAFLAAGEGQRVRIMPFPEKKEEIAEKINNSALKNRLDCGRIKGTVILRRKAPGDRMAPAWRRAGSRPLKKLCQEAGIPPEERQRLLVAEDREGIIWAQHFGADRRCAWGEDSARGCVIEIIREDEKDGNASGHPAGADQ